MSDDSWRAHYARVFDARERWLETPDPSNLAAFEAAFDEYRARFDCSSCERDGQLCRCAFDDSPKPLPERIPTMTKQSKDYEDGRRFGEEMQQQRDARDFGRIHDDLATRHLRPLALSKQTADDGQRAVRAELDVRAAEDRRQRSQTAMAAKNREQPHLDADDGGHMRTCSACDKTFEDGEKCPGCGGPGDEPAAPTAHDQPKRAHTDAASVPPWKRPLQMSSERAAPTPSQARTFAPVRRFGGPDEVA